MSRAYFRSFSGGELTPEFLGQLADAKFQTGLALCRNFRVLPHGPVQNRAGFEFVREVKDSTKVVRLLPFEFSTTQTMVLEVGENYIRFHTQGATLLLSGSPYEVTTPYLASQVFGINYVQSNDVLTLVHTGHRPAELRRLGVTTWTLTDISFATTLAPPTLPLAGAVLGGTPGTPTLHQYAITAVAPNNVDQSLISGFALSNTRNPTAITNASPGVITLGPTPHVFVVGDPVEVEGVLGMTQINGLDYTVNTVPSATSITLALNGVPVNTTAFGAYTSGGSVSLKGVKNNLFDTGARNNLIWGPVTGALRYNVFKRSNGLWGYIGQAAGNSFVDDNITPDISNTPPEQSDPFAAAGDYPGAVTYFEQRRVFAGTINRPQTIWTTRSGTESNMSYSVPGRDADAITFRVVARQANTVRHLVPINNLMALTSAAEWRIGTADGGALTGDTVSAKPQSYVGAASATPALVNNNIIFAAARGGHLRELAFNNDAGGYLTGDLSLRAPHLFDDFDIVDMAFSKAPIPTLWAVSSSGKLLGLTYVPEQQVGAIHRHDTDGTFESICVVAEGKEDVLYAVVRRTIGGVQKRYIERLRPRAFATQADCFFVDSGLTYSGTATNTPPLDMAHLEGKTVSVLADGATHRPVVITAGILRLDFAAAKVQCGLPITADFQSLPLAVERAGYGQGEKKAVKSVSLRVVQTSGIRAGDSFDRLTEFKTRTNEPYGTPPRLQTDVLEVVPRSGWTDEGQVCVRQQEPLPVTISSMALDFAMGG